MGRISEAEREGELKNLDHWESEWVIGRKLRDIVTDAQADALEAAAKENDKAAEFEEANEHDFDSVAIPMHAAAALKTTAAAIRKLKEQVRR